MNLGAAQQLGEPVDCRFGGEDVLDETTPQRRLDEVGTFGKEARGVATFCGTLQLDRRSYPIRLLRQEGQAASPDGAFTSSGRAAFATSTSAVNAASSLIAISDRFLRSTSTPASFRPWINRL